MSDVDRTDPNYQAARATFVSLQRTLIARRVLPVHLQPYADVTRAEIDWMGLVERVERGRHVDAARVEDRAAVALVAHLLGFEEALRVAPAPTFGALCELVDKDTRTEVLGGLTLLNAVTSL